MTNFDDLSRGEQFLLLQQRDYEAIVKGHRDQIQYIKYMMERYPGAYGPEDVARMLTEIEVYKLDIEYYSQYIKGAENEEPLTESHKESESPIDTFKGVTCTTV
jgi:hypothetical protein